nr:hypothetical protein BgiMline_020963 [Biomphalaria glabrata]
MARENSDEFSGNLRLFTTSPEFFHVWWPYCFRPSMDPDNVEETPKAKPVKWRRTQTSEATKRISNEKYEVQSSCPVSHYHHRSLVTVRVSSRLQGHDTTATAIRSERCQPKSQQFIFRQKVFWDGATCLNQRDQTRLLSVEQLFRQHGITYRRGRVSNVELDHEGTFGFE